MTALPPLHKSLALLLLLILSSFDVTTARLNGAQRQLQGATACPAGEQLFDCSHPMGCICQGCPIGTFSDAHDADPCQPCDPGQYQANTGANQCMDCAPGRYQDQPGKLSCLPCPTGTYQDMGGQEMCTPCPENHVQPLTAITAKNLCTPCATGYTPNADRTECIDEETSRVSGPALLSPPSGSGGITGDPHVQKWDGTWYDYNGECDLVLLAAPVLDLSIHVRTTIRHHLYSYIVAAAIRLGNEVLEVGSWGEYFVNGVEGARRNEMAQHRTGLVLPPLGEYPIQYEQVNKKKHIFVIAISEQHNITVTTFKDFVNVHVNLPSTSLETSQGLMGDYHTGKPVARDGTTVIEDVNQFGQEWQVQPSQDGSSLFLMDRPPQAPKEICRLPPKEQSRSSSHNNSVLHQAAVKACEEHAHQNRDACVMDIIATGDLELSESGAF